MIRLTPGLQRKIAFALVLLTAAPLAGAATTNSAQAASTGTGSVPAPQQSQTQQTTPPQTQPQSTTPPPAPEPQPAIVTNPTARQTGSQNDAAQAPPAASPSSQQPVGTAAAPVVPSTGIPASRPAGAAIAPAKQRRKRSFAIRVGLLVGAAVAIGAVTAASLSSPGRAH